MHWCGAATVRYGKGGQTRSCQARAKKLGSIPRRAWTAAANLFTQISAFLYWNTIGRSSVGDLRIRTWGCRESRLGWMVPRREGGGQEGRGRGGSWYGPTWDPSKRLAGGVFGGCKNKNRNI